MNTSRLGGGGSGAAIQFVSIASRPAANPSSSAEGFRLTHWGADHGGTPMHIRRQRARVGLLSGQQSQSPDMASWAGAICNVMLATGPLNRAGAQPIQRLRNSAATRFGAQSMELSIVDGTIASVKKLLSSLPKWSAIKSAIGTTRWFSDFLVRSLSGVKEMTSRERPKSVENAPEPTSKTFHSARLFTR